MNRYLYVLGFESPEQIRQNDELGRDHEDSLAVWIIAPSEASALEWGREISERYIQQLFGDPSASWRTRGYAHWIEPAPQVNFPDLIPEVRIGEFPDFTKG